VLRIIKKYQQRLIEHRDFAEETADGKGNTHWTITVVYQKENAPGEVIAPNLEVSEAKNLTVTAYNVPIKPCSKPKPQVAKRTHEFEVNATGVDDCYELTTLGWIIASALSKEKEDGESGKSRVVLDSCHLYHLDSP